MKRLLLSITLAASLLSARGLAQQTPPAPPAGEQPVTAATPPAKPRFTITELVGLGGACEGMGINSDGHVAGTCLVGSKYLAFLWKDGVVQGLGTLGINFRARKAAREAEWHAALAALNCEIPAGPA